MPRDKDAPQRTYLTEGQLQILKDAIWYCDIAKLNDELTMAYINSGILGYVKLTAKQIEARKAKGESINIPITIGLTKYHEVKTALLDPKNLNKELYQYSKGGFIKNVITMMKMMQFGMSKTMENGLATKDVKDSQFVINSMFRNSVYFTQFSEVVKKIIEHKIVPIDDQTMKELEKEFGIKATR